MAEWEKRVIKELVSNGYTFIRHGKGSHDIYSDGVYTVPIPKMIGKNLANIIMKEAHIDKRW
jgi:predicted RNA binding protein YcfA (HicA-like mRNA interferase family)